MKLKSFLQFFGILAITLTIVPFIAVDYWWIRVFDFPHVQLTILTLIAILAYFIRFDVKWFKDYVFISLLIGCFIFQLYKIYPYTPFGEKDVLAAVDHKPEDNLKVLISNVLQKNKESELLIEEVKAKDPDILLLCEVNQRWLDDVRSVTSQYEYKLEEPLDNTYGMALYSKFPLEDSQIRFMVDDSIPSMHTIATIRSGKKIQIHAIHPTPPMPQHNPTSTDRDAEMMITAFMTLDRDKPTMVIGDFNDVAWSNTTKLFKEVSRTLDVRYGRGFFNTFNANNFLLRWPLDHIFISEEFRAVDVQRGNDVGSDHFPSYAELSLEPQNAAEQLPEEPSEQSLENAREQMKRMSERAKIQDLFESLQDRLHQ